MTKSMEKTIILNITQEDIDKSIKNADMEKPPSGSCVVSTAAQRQFNNPLITSAAGKVFMNTERCSTEGEVPEYDGGYELQNLMNKFDSGQYASIAPRSYTLILNNND